MKSIKPGRGPSTMNAVGEICAAIFGVIWTVLASQIGAPPVFCLFGVVFILAAVINAIYNFANATRKNRFSALDIVEDQEEPDPLNRRFGQQTRQPHFCAQCGARLPADAKFCPGCGTKVEDE